MPALLDLHHPEALPAGPVEVVGEVASGQLRVKDPLDFESDRSHEVTVSVSDSKDAAGSADTAVDASIAVTVVVENVDEPPELMGDADVSYRENDTGEVAEFTAEDSEGGLLTWEPLGGADLDDFTFADGTLEFVDPPDRETPTDHDGDNTDEVVVTVSDGANSVDVAVTVTVADVNEPFTLEGDTALDYNEDSTGEVGVWTVVDPEGGPIDWELSGTDRGDFTIDDGSIDGLLFFDALAIAHLPGSRLKPQPVQQTMTRDNRLLQHPKINT